MAHCLYHVWVLLFSPITRKYFYSKILTAHTFGNHSHITCNVFVFKFLGYLKAWI